MKSRFVHFFKKAFLLLIINGLVLVSPAQVASNECSIHKQKSTLNRFLFEKNFDKNFTSNYDLKYHKLEWTVNPSILQIQGAITSIFKVGDQDMNEMYFDLSDAMTVSSVQFNDVELSFTQNEKHLIVLFDESLVANEVYEIKITYAGVPDEDGANYLVSNVHNGHPGMYSFSEPYGAMEWWPCKQDLNDKIDSIDVYVTVPEDLKVASNGTLQSVVQDGSYETHFWKHRHPIPAYLIAFAVTNYNEFSVNVPHDSGEIEILNYVFPETMPQAQMQTEVMVEAMLLLNDKFGLYPFADEKYGHAQWGRGGGMEHTTMSFMNNFGTFLVVHEMAHQWFGDQVTCGSWEDIWLNEGFATYCEGLFYEHQAQINDENTNWYAWRVSTLNAITSLNDGSVWVEDTTNVSRIFDGRLSYRKGAYLLHMLRLELGDENFFMAIRNYLADPNLAFSYARTNDLKMHLEMVHGESLDEFFDDWFYGEGFPIHYIQYTQKEGHLLVKISQYQSDPSVSFYEMNIPIRMSGLVGQEEDVVLDYQFDGQIFEIPVGFQVSNVIYDPELWNISGGNTVEENPLLEGSELSFGVFPNPTSEMLTLRLNRIVDSEFEVDIYDIQGRKINAEISTLGQLININVQQLSEGNYKVVLISNDVSIQKPFVIVQGD